MKTRKPIKINIGTPWERLIGVLDERKGIFEKIVWESKHLFRIIDAWGMDSAFFNAVLLPKSYDIKIYDKETGKTYHANATTIRQKGEYYHFKRPGRDDRTQIFLRRKYWKIVEPKTEDEKAEELSKLCL